MPSTLSYPGVYVEEIPSGVRTIVGVATSIAAFVGYTTKGPINKAVRIFNFGDYVRTFGDFHPDSDVSYSVDQFFRNGGSDAYVVRVTKDGIASTGDLKGGGVALLTVQAKSPGMWANLIEAVTDYQTNNPDNTFNLTVNRFADAQKVQVVESEKLRNLSMNNLSPSYVVNVVNAGSKLVNIQLAQNVNFAVKGLSKSGDLSVIAGLSADEHDISVEIDGAPAIVLTLSHPEGINTVAAAVTKINDAITAAGAQLDVAAAGTGLTLTSKDTTQKSSVRVIPAASNDASPKLKLGSLNGGKEVEGAASKRPDVGNTASLAGGNDGKPPTGLEIKGDFDKKTGMYSLRDVDLFNLLVIPVTGTDKLGEAETQDLLSTAAKFCGDERAFFLVDPYPGKASQADLSNFVSAIALKKNSALFFPHIKVADPLQNFRLRAFPPSGAIAGIFARTDTDRGVWKAPAGIDTSIAGSQALDIVLTNEENGVFNQEGINCLRSFPTYGRVVWGARTLDGSDKNPSDWKYIPVRRTALYIEESLYRGTQWVVFEPNDEPLWAQIRLSVGAFMHGLFRLGAFQGSTPREAYFVKCSAETTTQDDINQGIVNIIVGFAPLKPAEFVIIKLQQMAGQIDT